MSDLQILGTGEYTPGTRVESTVFDERFGQPTGWTEQSTGIASRAFAAAAEDVVTMGVAAAKEALAESSIDARELDAIIAVGSVPAQSIPCTAALIQRALGLEDSGIPAFDVNATCLGFLAALDLVAPAIAVGRYRRVLLVASERPSSGLNWGDPQTSALFADGAGAAVVGFARDRGAKLLGSHLQTFSAGARFCQIRAGGTLLHPHADAAAFMEGTYIEMRGRHLYRMAAERLPAFLAELYRRAGVTMSDIDAWVPHQASGQAIDHLMQSLRLPADKVMVTLRTHGNQVAASLPIALHRARRSGLIRPGSVVALVGTGAGLSFGGAILRTAS